MRTRSNESPELDIPPEAAETIGRARAMQADGWAALADMGDAELDEFEAEVDASYVWQPGAHGSASLNMPVHPHNQVRLDALSAITAERTRRRHEADARSRAVANRARCIGEAAEHISAAVDKLEVACAIGAVGWPWPYGEPPALDVPAASDGELERMAATCRDRAHVGVVGPANPYAEQAVAIGQLKGKAARDISAELEGLAAKLDANRGTARALLAEIEAEQARRAREREAADALRSPETMESRIAELEKQLAGKAGE